MAIRELVPWKWGGLRRWEGEEGEFGSFRRQMDSLHHEMDRLFEDMTGFGMRRMTYPRLWGGREQLFPEIDETEDDKAFHVSIELPGLTEKDVDITLTGRVLTIRGEKKREEEEKGKEFYRRERSFGAFRRAIELPGEVDEKAIEAEFHNGVLKIELPKTKEAQAKIKHIEVKAA